EISLELERKQIPGHAAQHEVGDRTVDLNRRVNRVNRTLLWLDVGSKKEAPLGRGFRSCVRQWCRRWIYGVAATEQVAVVELQVVFALPGACGTNGAAAPPDAQALPEKAVGVMPGVTEADSQE